MPRVRTAGDQCKPPTEAHRGSEQSGVGVPITDEAAHTIPTMVRVLVLRQLADTDSERLHSERCHTRVTNARDR